MPPFALGQARAVRSRLDSRRSILRFIEGIADMISDINAQNEDGETALHFAASEGNAMMVGTLIDLGANLDVKNIHGETPLYLAVENRHFEIVRTLVNLGAYINEENKDGDAPLHRAALEGDIEMARALIEMGAYIDAENERGITPLHYAASEGNARMARILVEEGADVNPRDKRGRTPLHYASWEGNTGVARALIAVGASVNIRDICGYAPPDYLGWKGGGGIEGTSGGTGHIENAAEEDSGCGTIIAVAAILIGGLTGVYFLIDNFGVWGFVWRLALIISGLWVGLRADDSGGRWFGGGLIGGGVFFTLIALDTIPGWIVGSILAVALIAVSVRLFRQRHR